MTNSENRLSDRTDRRIGQAWVSAGVLAAGCGGLAYALPVFDVNDRWLHDAPWRQVLLWVGSVTCLLAALGVLVAHRWRTSVLGHDNLETIRWLSTREFNQLVEDGFRRQGYLVQSSERSFAGSGIDLILRKAHRHILVLCRREIDPARQLAAVQELHAATATLHGCSGLMITSETVSADVKRFAAEHAIAVIEGQGLLKLVQRARGDRISAPARKEPHFSTPLTALPACPQCGGPMIPDLETRVATGENAWRCVRGPDCRTPHLAS
jgi:restriction system protein